MSEVESEVKIIKKTGLPVREKPRRFSPNEDLDRPHLIEWNTPKGRKPRPYTVRQVVTFFDLLRGRFEVRSDEKLIQAAFPKFEISRQQLNRMIWVYGIPYSHMKKFKKKFPDEFKQAFGDLSF